MEIEIVQPLIESYISRLAEEEPLDLKALREKTEKEFSSHHMISGHYQGRLLSLISKLVRPKLILEIGTFTGYSALCLCEGLSREGVLITIDSDKKSKEIANKYFHTSSYRSQIRQHHGKALEVIPELNHKFDLAFIDADKQNYAQYFDLLITKMNSGGVILSDNVLWSGKVVSANHKEDKRAVALEQYNEKLRKDSRVQSIILPVRDGLSISWVI